MCCQNEDSSSAPHQCWVPPPIPSPWVTFLPNEAEVAPLKDQLQIVSAKLPLAPGAPFSPILLPAPAPCWLLMSHVWVD